MMESGEFWQPLLGTFNDITIARDHSHVSTWRTNRNIDCNVGRMMNFYAIEYCYTMLCMA